MLRRIGGFWFFIAAGTVLIALGSASLGFAYANRNYAELPSQWTDSAGWTNYVPLGVSFDAAVGGSDDACFGCVDPTPWLVAGAVVVALSSVPFALAVRLKRRG
jgi:hypothetical protein